MSRPGIRAWLPVLVGWVLICSAPASLAAEVLERSRAIADEFQQALGSRLKSAIAQGGPVAAIEVCAEVAPAIAAQVSAQSGAVVGRTALRVRNPDNAPDGDAERVLEAFAERVAAGESLPVEHLGSVPGGGARYMRAIVLQPLCATCHGASLAPAVAAAIAQRYPLDLATGYAVGELRGAFLIDWPAPESRP